MQTPYDWQEAIGQRAQYVATRLKSGVPVVGLSVQEGVLAMTMRRNAPKLYEVYDRLMMGVIGQQSDVEQLRVAAIEFAHREGYQRSEQDVGVQRVASAISQPVKSAFSDPRSAPVVARCLFLEVGEVPSDDLYYALDFDGDYVVDRNSHLLVGDAEAAVELKEALAAGGWAELTVSEAEAKLRPVLEAVVAKLTGEDSEIRYESALLARDGARDRRFRFLTSAGH